MDHDLVKVRQRSARRLGIWALAFAAAVFAFVPLYFDPTEIILYLPAAFYLPKLDLLVKLSIPLVVAVAGHALLNRRPISLPMLAPVLVFLGVSAASTLLSDDIMRSLIGAPSRYDGLLSLAAGVLLFYAAASFIDSWAKVRVLLVAGVTAAVIIAVYGLLQQFRLDPVLQTGIPWYTREPVTGNLGQFYIVTDRATSTLGHGIWLAAYLTLMIGAALALYFRSEARWERGLWLVAMALMSACWLYTFTRGAMLGVGLTVPVMLFFAHRRLGSMKPLLLPLVVMMAAVVVAQFASPQTTSILSRFGDANLAPTLEEVQEGGGDVSVTTRLMMWRDTIPVILERPLIGHGPDNFAEPFARHEGEDLRAFFPNGEVIDKAHNELFQVAATTGLLGLAAYIWIFVSYFRHAYRSGGWPLLALSGGVLAYILQLQTAFTTIATGVTFWAILGVSVAIMRLQEGETHRTDEDDAPARDMGASRSVDIQ